MPVTPFRVRVIDLAPDWLRDGTGERLLYLAGLCADASMERTLCGVEASDPLRANDSCLAVIGQDLLIPRGLTESTTSYGWRLHQALDAWRMAGFARALLGQVLGYLLDKQPRIRMVSTRYERDPAREMAIARASGIVVTGATNATPIVITTPSAHGYTTGWEATIAGVTGNLEANGSFAITVLSSTTFSLTGTAGAAAYVSGGKVIASPETVAFPPAATASQWETYAVAADTNLEPTHTVGTIGGDGEWDWDSLSQTDGSWSWYGGFVIIESVGAEAWVDDALAWGSDVYWGDDVAWGTNSSANIGGSIVAILKLWKTAGLWIRSVIVSFDATLFDPAQPAGGGVNPDGYFGRWSKHVNGQRVAARFDNARYGGEVI